MFSLYSQKKKKERHFYLWPELPIFGLRTQPSNPRLKKNSRVGTSEPDLDYVDSCGQRKLAVIGQFVPINSEQREWIGPLGFAYK